MLNAILAHPFDYPFDGTLDPARTAILAIDLQIDFLSPDGYLAAKGYDPAPLRALLPNVAASIALTLRTCRFMSGGAGGGLGLRELRSCCVVLPALKSCPRSWWMVRM